MVLVIVILSYLPENRLKVVGTSSFTLSIAIALTALPHAKGR